MTTPDANPDDVHLRIRLVSSTDDIDAEAWDALDHGPSPFLRYGFLRALELSGSIGPRSGWGPCFLLAESATDVDDPDSFTLRGSYRVRQDA
jgi:predicted N-acyltransferase